MYRQFVKYNLLAIAVVLIIATGFGCQQNITVESELDKRSHIAQMYQKLAQDFPLVKSITVEELQQLQQQHKNIILVDVRPQNERKVSMIPGAIAREEFEANLEKYQDAIAIAYCTIGYRSGKYAQKLQSRGINMLNLEGSLLAWSHIQGKLVNSRGTTKKIHVFNRQWQLAADNYQAVW